jgi:hypothetical protein
LRQYRQLAGDLKPENPASIAKIPSVLNETAAGTRRMCIGAHPQPVDI